MKWDGLAGPPRNPPNRGIAAPAAPRRGAAAHAERRTPAGARDELAAAVRLIRLVDASRGRASVDERDLDALLGKLALAVAAVAGE